MYKNNITVEPHLSAPQLSGCSDNPASRSSDSHSLVWHMAITKWLVLRNESSYPRIAVLDRLKAGATQDKLADEYGIGHSTVGRFQEERG